MSNEDIMSARVANLNRVQEERKQQTLAKVEQALERMVSCGVKINFSTLATEASVSQSYLYKYPEIKTKIAQIRNQQSSMPRPRSPEPASAKSNQVIVSKLKDRIKKLEAEVTGLRNINEGLAGRVYRVSELEAMIERQQKHIKDLEERLMASLAQAPTVKVTPMAQAKSLQDSVVIQEELKSSGLRLTESLNRLIREHDEKTVLLAIKAFKQYKETHEIQSLAGCLRRAIESGWVPNEAAEPSTPEQDEFDQFYTDAVATGFLLDVPKNHLSVQGGEFVVKINRASVYGSWTPMPWQQAKAEYEEQFLISRS